MGESDTGAETGKYGGDDGQTKQKTDKEKDVHGTQHLEKQRQNDH